MVSLLTLVVRSYSFWVLGRICRYEPVDVLSGLVLHANGRAGSALAVKNWAWQLTHPAGEPLPAETPYANQGLLIESVKESLEAGRKQSGRSPKILVIGAVSRPFVSSGWD